MHFISAGCNRSSNSADKGFHKKIAKAAELARKHVQTIIAGHSESAKISRLVEWVQFIKDEAKIILLTVPAHFNTFVMFETLNDRGLRSSQADLLKNYLLSQAGERVVEAQQKWAQMLGVLESLGEADITVTYLRHLLTCLYGHTKSVTFTPGFGKRLTAHNALLSFSIRWLSLPMITPRF